MINFLIDILVSSLRVYISKITNLMLVCIYANISLNNNDDFANQPLTCQAGGPVQFLFYLYFEFEFDDL